MVNFSYQISNLLFVLIAVKITRNAVEAGKISSLSKFSTNEGSIVPENPLNNENILPSSESPAETSALASRDLEETSDDSRGSTVYSYFYVGRWTWHIPLWFTLWFTFYVAFNVVRSIYGHSVRSSSR